MALPQSLVMLTEEEFAARAAGVPAIAFEGGELPAFFGYDGVPTLAYRTMVRCGLSKDPRPFHPLYILVLDSL